MEAFRPFMSFAKTESNIRDLTESENTDVETQMTSQSLATDNLSDNISSNVEGEIVQDTEIPAASATTPPPTEKNKGNINRRRKRSKEASEESPTAAVIPYLTSKSRCNQNASDVDTIDLIFSGYAKTFKIFSPRLQVFAKFKFAEFAIGVPTPARNNLSTVLSKYYMFIACW